MNKKSPYSILFEPVTIGPVKTNNRFYQVPHCTGMGYLKPQAEAALRGIKAQGGWGVVSTQETEIHPSSDLSPFPEQRIWDKRDIPALRLMTDTVHTHGSLAAIQLAHNGFHSPNLYTRTPPLAPEHMSVDSIYPKQAKRMSKSDIKELRRWHRNAALNAKAAGFDIIYVYAGHGMTLTQHFMLPEFNNRADEYGGSLENRIRLTRELLEDTLDAVGDTCAVAFRFAVDELKGKDGMQSHEEGRAVVELLSELPDLWDVNISDWSNDSQTARFEPNEGYQTPFIEFVKTITTKPVVGVGRLTSPDLMVRLINNQTLDLIGAARPSIADPYLPNKIKEDKIDEIRECIGCNICVSSDNLGVPIRCTQNPTIGEEWRRSWHPETIKSKKSDKSALVVGAGAAGLECTMQLARRGYDVILSEKSDTLGGRVVFESNIKGLSSWRRVSDYRINEIRQKANVQVYKESVVTPELVDELGIENIFIATGCYWRNDGVGRSNRRGITGLSNLNVLTPSEALTQQDSLADSIVIYDDDQGYLASAIADHLSSAGHNITFVTPASVVSPWTEHTLEQHRIQSSLLNQGVTIITNKTIIHAEENNLSARCVYTGNISHIPCKTLILVTERTPDTTLYTQLSESIKKSTNSKPYHIELLGDALAPGLIADAVYSGHLAAQNFESPEALVEQSLYQREITSLR